MTRTERNQFPAALLRDKHSRSGLVKSEQDRKHGAGAHNWGSFRQEGEHELNGDADAAIESASADEAQTGFFDMEAEGGDVPQVGKNANAELGMDGMQGKDFKKDVLGENGVATSPSESMSSVSSAEGFKGRRMSNVSDEERERARVYREGVLGKGPVDLAHIARTSYGIAQSPPNGNAFATSPTKTKGVFMAK